jgi:glycosyltransferase involved in cell wall biosynthesis
MERRSNTSNTSIRLPVESPPADTRHVLVVQEHLPHYRAPFFEQLRSLLCDRRISLDLIYSAGGTSTLLPGKLSWATPVPTFRCGGLVYQHVSAFVRTADLVIMPQEVKYVSLAYLFGRRVTGSIKLAFWGHGRNMQARNRNSWPERVKRFLSTRVDWWFAYNERSAAVVRELGFPEKRITLVQNAIDTKKVIEVRNELSPEAIKSAQATLGIDSKNVAIYTGGLYEEKRIPFLLEASAKVRVELPDFHLIIIGGGPQKDLVTEAAQNNGWIHYLGPKNDAEKLPYWAISKVSLIPGAVGLGILDSFALGVPLITSRTFGHGPEIAYLKPGINGVMVEEANDPNAYAAAVVHLLRNDKQRASMIQAGLRECETLNIESMARNFAEGIEAALRADKLKRVPR